MATFENSPLFTNLESREFDYGFLVSELRRAGYIAPAKKIHDMMKSGVLIGVKKGLYALSPSYARGPICKETLANLIYGPSYVSLDSALSYHGLIPERVEAVTSGTTGRSRVFDTPFGAFTYHSLPPVRYAFGVLLETRGTTPFLIASPEKALADKVWVDKRFAGTRVGDADQGSQLVRSGLVCGPPPPCEHPSPGAADATVRRLGAARSPRHRSGADGGGAVRARSPCPGSLAAGFFRKRHQPDRSGRRMTEPAPIVPARP